MNVANEDGMKILLLEDDSELREYITRSLEAMGHVIDVCTTGREAIVVGSDGTHAALILDRMVPGVDGLSVLKALRAAGMKAPAVLLTAMGEIDDRVEGLEAGADDYIVKPFALRELTARLDALVRRPHLSEVQTHLQVGDLTIDLLKRSAIRAGQSIPLQAQEFKLLEYLVRHAGQIVTRTMLLEQVWSFHFDPRTNIIESHMSRLRAKVDRAFDRPLIKTVRGAGYMIDDAP